MIRLSSLENWGFVAKRKYSYCSKNYYQVMLIACDYIVGPSKRRARIA